MSTNSQMIIQKPNLTPKLLFDFMVDGITAMSKGERVAPDANVKFNINTLEGTSLAVTCFQATDEELQALMVLRKKLMKSNGGNFPCHSDVLLLTIGINAEGREYVTIRTRTSNNVGVREDGSFFASNGQQRWKNFMYYGNGIIFCKNEMHNNGKLWPCTMKDLFESDLLSQRCACLLLMEFFAKEHLLWGDLTKDFLEGSAYSSIPLSEIWAAHSREELLRNHYGVSMKRNNKETIGQGIFLIQAARLVKANEIQKLHGFNPGRVYIGRKKKDLVRPLADYIMQSCPDIDKPVKLAHGYSTKVEKMYVEDAINTEILLRRKISVSFHSPRGVLDWHDEASRIFRSRTIDTVKIPKNSKFKKLQLPPNCVRLTTRRQFLEEGDFQHNCVASYIERVNSDVCSIWSMRKEDGTRNTIEIRCRKSKGNPSGYFYIAQMTAFGNSSTPKKDYKLVSDSISRQKPYFP